MAELIDFKIVRYGFRIKTGEQTILRINQMIQPVPWSVPLCVRNDYGMIDQTLINDMARRMLRKISTMCFVKSV